VLGWRWYSASSGCGCRGAKCRFPQAFILIPAAMAIMFALNIMRVAALIMIGSAGAARVAMSGFHSQAGWIAFNAVALGVAWIAPRIAWFTVGERQLTRSHALGNQTVPYLLPFAAILAAGMVSKAAADGFEWLYPLRFVAAVVALWLCRHKYAALNWASWLAPGLRRRTGFRVWVVLERGAHADNGIASGLSAMSAPARMGWISIRTLAAVTTVPIAEELAFRGFLLRRLVSSEFESVDFRRYTWLAVVGSSFVFGLMHGKNWMAGTFAGAVYAGVMLRRGRIGDAVAAHAMTNGLLAVCVLSGGNWYFW